MTQPIQEPGQTTRTDARLTWGQNQLFRRPGLAASAGDDGHPYAVMQWLDGGDVDHGGIIAIEDIGGGTPYNDGYINPAGLAMTPDPFSFELTDGVINFMSPGLYLAELMVEWADEWPSGAGGITDPSYILTKLSYINNAALIGNCCTWSSRDVMFTNQDWQTPFAFASGLIISADSQPFLCGFKGQVMQINSDGTPKFLATASIAVVKLADYFVPS